MEVKNNRISLDDSDWKEIFSLFCSPTQYEIGQIYSEGDDQFYQTRDLNREHTLTQEEREFAIDAWRSVLYFLRAKGFTLSLGKEEVDLEFIKNYICD